MLDRLRAIFRQDDWDLSGSQFVATLSGIALAFVVSALMGLELPYEVKVIGAFVLAPFGFQALLEITETLTGKNKHVGGKVAIYGLIAGVLAFILPSLIIGYFVSPVISFSGAATDIALVSGFSTPLSMDARLFLITQAVSDDLAGLTVIIATSGLHESLPLNLSISLGALSLICFLLSMKRESVKLFVVSGIFSTTALFGIGIEPLLGMSFQAIWVGLMPNNEEWRRGVKNVAAIAATIGLFLFISTHLSFGSVALGASQLAFNLSMLAGKFIPTFPLMLGAGASRRDAVLGSLMSATSGTVGLLFLEIAKNQGGLTPELEGIATSGIIVSILTGMVFCAIAYLMRKK